MKQFHAIKSQIGSISKTKIKAAVGLSALVVVLVAVLAVNWHARQKGQSISIVTTPSATAKAVIPSPIPTPALKPDLLTGELVPTGSENLHPLAVMIENHPDARPQSGLGQADLVYEAIAEGGITRFMAVYSNPNQIIRVGPIRSARTYFLDFATELHAMYAHVGGNTDALDQIATVGGVDDLNQFTIGEPVFKRDFSRNVALEHTMYSSTDKLWNFALSTRHYLANQNYVSWLFQPKSLSQAASQTVKVAVSSREYDVSWQYDPASNSYKRTMAGSSHVDTNTGKQIEVKNIVIETVDRQPVVTRINEQGWHYVLTGTGRAVVIQNGIAVVGSWKKTGAERTRYFNDKGVEIAFVTGSTWVHIVHPDSQVSY